MRSRRPAARLAGAPIAGNGARGAGSPAGTHAWRLTRAEVSGGLADIGVLVPLEVSLIAVNGLSPTSTLLGAGITYVLAGLYFRIPMPVQPLKAFAVIAVAQQLAPGVISAGALLMAAALALLAGTGLVGLLARVVPLTAVRGVQVGLGLLLIKNAVETFWTKPFFIGGARRFVDIGAGDLFAGVPLSLVVGGGMTALLLLAAWRRWAPAVLVLAAGAALGLALGAGEAFRGAVLGPAPVRFGVPSAADFATALTLLVVPQLALTLANSVIATVDAARVYFGETAARVTPRRVSVSIALANVWAGLAGGLPVCHGSGGLTAHYRLGARTPVATLFVGALLVLIAVMFGRAALPVRGLVPYAVFGALLLYVGWQHLQLGLRLPRRAHVVLAAAGGVIGALPSSSLAWGLAAGVAVWWTLRLAARLPAGPGPAGAVSRLASSVTLSPAKLPH